MLKVRNGIEVEPRRGEHSLGIGEYRQAREAEVQSDDQLHREALKTY